MSIISFKPTSQPAWKGDDLEAAGKEIDEMNFSEQIQVIEEAPSSEVAALAALQCLALAKVYKDSGDTPNLKVCLKAVSLAYWGRRDGMFHKHCLDVAQELGLTDDILESFKR